MEEAREEEWKEEQEENKGIKEDFLESLPSADRENFTRLCNKMLSSGFLCKKKAGSKFYPET